MATGNQFGIPQGPSTEGGDPLRQGVDMSGKGLLRIVSNSELQQRESDASEAAQRVIDLEQQGVEDALASYVRNRMSDMRNFRNAEGISERLLAALRTYKGEYDQGQLNAIQDFGGSEV